jgi:hypothetical protein
MDKGFSLRIIGTGIIMIQNPQLRITNDLTFGTGCNICRMCKSQNVLRCKLAGWFMQNDINNIGKTTTVPNVSKRHFVEMDSGKPATAVIELNFGNNSHNVSHATMQAGIWYGYAMNQRRSSKSK